MYCFLLLVKIDLKIKTNPNEIIVEGHIENDLPPYVILTKSISLYDNININNLGNFFVSGAAITVKTDNDSVQLVEYNSAIYKPCCEGA